jgi:hypothetical protein
MGKVLVGVALQAQLLTASRDFAAYLEGLFMGSYSTG